jgi:hypothetical protein
VWVLNTRYEEAEQKAQLLDIVSVVAFPGDSKRYPLRIQVPPTATWDDLIQAWHQQAEVTKPKAYTRLPVNSGGYEFHDAHGNVVLNLTDTNKIYSYTVVLIPGPPAELIDPTLLNQFHVNVLYNDPNEHRMYIQQGFNMEVFPDEPEQCLLERWIEQALRDERVTQRIKNITRMMSKEASSYEWRMKVDQPIRHPWKAYDVIRFRSRQCSSTDPQFTSSSKKGNGSGAPPDGAPSPRFPGPDAPQGPPAPTEASSYTTSTAQSKGNVDVRVMIDGGPVWRMSVHCKTFYEDLRRSSEDETNQMLDNFWSPVTMEGEGCTGHWCSGDLVKDLPEITEFRTSATYEPVPHPISLVSAPNEKDWLIKLRQTQTFIQWGQFRAQIIHDKMIHIVTDRGAQ